jgi:D-alanyl-D-alanine dipeptidase
MSCLNNIVFKSLFCLLPLLKFSCEQRQSAIKHADVQTNASLFNKLQKDTTESSVKNKHEFEKLTDDFVDYRTVDPNVILDIRYATTNNFTNVKLYPCSRCLLKKATAQSLLKVNDYLKTKNLQLKVLDCYRPPTIQEKLWKVKPDPHFVMRPWKGSPHSRGIAVDVTLTDLSGKELDMGSDYDEFSQKSYYASDEISKIAKDNRWILKSAMKQAGFSSIRTEWWHFQKGINGNHPIVNIELPCDLNEENQ